MVTIKGFGKFSADADSDWVMGAMNLINLEAPEGPSIYYVTTFWVTLPPRPKKNFMNFLNFHNFCDFDNY